MAQIPLRFDPIDNNLIRTGYYYLPSQWQSKALPVMVLFHGLEGYGLDTMNAGSGGSFVVSPLLTLMLGVASLALRVTFMTESDSTCHSALIRSPSAVILVASVERALIKSVISPRSKWRSTTSTSSSRRTRSWPRLRDGASQTPIKRRRSTCCTPWCACDHELA